MDKLVADGFFDKWRPDINYRFVPYMHNVPLWETSDSYVKSYHSSDIQSSAFESTGARNFESEIFRDIDNNMQAD